MGLRKLEVYDEDGVSEVNVPNQFYRIQDIEAFKVDALSTILKDFSDTAIRGYRKLYSKEKLKDIVVVATDSMASRRLIFEQFKKQNQCKYYIEARMGAELGMIYSIKKRKEDYTFYERSLYLDKEVKPLACTAKVIIYNVLMISSLICRSVKSIVDNEKFPREVIFDMEHINKSSFMIRE